MNSIKVICEGKPSSMSHAKTTLACNGGANNNPDDNHRHGQHAKANLHPRFDDFDPKDRPVILAFFFGVAILSWLFCAFVVYTAIAEARANAAQRPDLSIRLLGKRGLDHPLATPPASPAFHLAFDAEGVSPRYRACCGGGDSLLRVSYHGMILAWGQVPRFCIHGDRSMDSVATVEAKAEASVLREEVRSLLWTELQVVGKVGFDVERERWRA